MEKELELINVLKNIKKIDLFKLTNDLKEILSIGTDGIIIDIKHDGTYEIAFLDGVLYKYKNNKPKYIQPIYISRLEFRLCYDLYQIINYTEEELQERIRSDYEKEVKDYLYFIVDNMQIEISKNGKLNIKY